MKAPLIPIFTLILLTCFTCSAEPSIVTLLDKVYVTPGSFFNITVLTRGLTGVRTFTVRLREGSTVLFQEIVQAREEALIRIRLQAPVEPGVYYIDVLANTSPLTVLARESEPLPVIDEELWREPLLICFVWHCHQGINMMPDGTFHGPWAFIHVYEDQFKPYFTGGAYALHATLLEKHPSIKVTINWSPSLLWQWLYASKLGYYDRLKATHVPANSTQVLAAKTLLDSLRALSRNGRMEVLSSFFNHPIPGYVAERFSWGLDAMAEELTWGLYVTRLAFDESPRGVWIPEMFFSMKLVDILNLSRVAYTVLDARYHLFSSRGDVGSPYEPYLLRSESGREIYVFFRDSELSDYISFEVNPRSEEEAKALARRFVARVLSRRLERPEARAVIVAADGENWLFGNSLKAVFLDAVFHYIELGSKVLKAATLSEALSKTYPRLALTWVPTTSWAGGDWVWTSRSENQLQWSLIGKAGEIYSRIKHECSDEGIKLASAFCLFMALNSDVIHIEYTMQTHTEAWSRQLEMICYKGSQEADKLLSRYMTPGIQKVRVDSDCRVCGSSLLDYLPQLFVALIAASALTIYLRGKRR